MRKPIYLYRAVATEFVHDAETLEEIIWPGATLGRATGYLSRSAAFDAGARSGFDFTVVRSEPIQFPTPPEVEVAELRAEIAHLREELAAVES